MPVSRNRDIATILGRSEALNADNTGLGSGLTVYSTLDDLPTTGLTSGDQAYVSSSSRFYISNGSGWYNVALVNATPALTIDPTGTIILAQDGSTASVLTLTGTDSDYPDANLTYSVESDGSFFGLGTISQDSSVFTITPLSQDSATTSSATLTFKASDGISFGSASRSFSLSFTTTNSHKTMSLIKADTSFNDNQVDASTNSLTITEYGNVTSSAFSPHHPGGYSTYFDGTGDYISIADGTYKTLGSDNWTYEGWVYPTSVAAGNKWVWGDHASSGAGNTTSINLLLDGANFRVFGWTTSSYDISGSTTISTNTWYHVAIVYDGSYIKMYVNGTEETSSAYSGSWNDGTGSFSVGRTGDYNGAYFSGYIRDVRLVKGTAVYTSSFTPPTAPLTAISGTEILLCHLPYIADGSTNGNAVTVGGNTSTKRVGPYDYLPYTKAGHGGSVYFDGTGDYLDVATASAADFGTGDFTVELWWYPTTPTANGVLLSGFNNANNSNNNVTDFYLGVGTNFRTPHVNTNFGGTWTTRISTTDECDDNAWNHVAYVRNGNTGNIYINGKKGPDYSLDAAVEFNNPFSSLWIFRNRQTDTNYGQGYLQDLRIVKGTAVYTADFTPPTQPLTAITNTELLTCTNRHDIVDVAGGSRITKTGQITTSDAARKWSTISSTYHQGSNDWYSFTLPQPLGNDFTVEMWVNHTSWSDNVGIWDFSGGYGLGAFGSRLKWWDNGNPPEYTIHENSEMDNLAGTWWHFALCRTGGNSYKAFINGSLEGSWTLSGGISQTIRIGNDQYGKDLLGYVQDVRVTNGLARYTAAFTPPTAEFDG